MVIVVQAVSSAIQLGLCKRSWKIRERLSRDGRILVRRDCCKMLKRNNSGQLRWSNEQFTLGLKVSLLSMQDYYF